MEELKSRQSNSIQSFGACERAEERIREIWPSLLRPERVYDPEDPNADETGHVWVVSLLPHPNAANKLYLCTDGYIR